MRVGFLPGRGIQCCQAWKGRLGPKISGALVDQPHLVRLYHSSRNDGIDTESAAWALLAVVLIGPKAWRMRDNPAVLVTVLALLLWLFS